MERDLDKTTGGGPTPLVDELIEKAGTEVAQTEWSELWDSRVRQKDLKRAERLINKVSKPLIP